MAHKCESEACTSREELFACPWRNWELPTLENHCVIDPAYVNDPCEGDRRYGCRCKYNKVRYMGLVFKKQRGKCISRKLCGRLKARYAKMPDSKKRNGQCHVNKEDLVLCKNVTDPGSIREKQCDTFEGEGDSLSVVCAADQLYGCKCKEGRVRYLGKFEKKLTGKCLQKRQCLKLKNKIRRLW